MERKTIIPLKNIPDDIKVKIHSGFCVIDYQIFFVRGLEKWTVHAGPCYYAKLITFYDENNKEIKYLLNYWALSYEKYVKK